MVTDHRLGRWLGAAYLFVVAASLTAGLLADAALSGAAQDVLSGVGEDPVPATASALIEVAATAIGIMVLAVLLHATVRHRSEEAARVALGLWVLEAAFMAAGAVATFVLVDAAVGGSASVAGAATLVAFHEVAHAIHMVFFATGGLIWYALMYRAGTVPRWLAGFGFVAVGLALVSTIGGLAGVDLNQIALGLPTGLFELTIGIWVIVRGVNVPARTPDGTVVTV